MISRVIHDCLRCFRMYAVDACLVGVLMMLLYGCIDVLIKVTKPIEAKNIRKYMLVRLPNFFCSFLLGAYLYYTACIALLSRTEEYIDEIDFSLLGAGLSYKVYQAFFVENIIMFIPFGVLMPICFKIFKNVFYLSAVGFFASLSIEVTQYVFKWGHFEVVDIWTNTLGAILGWCIGSILIWCYHKIRGNLQENKSHQEE